MTWIQAIYWLLDLCHEPATLKGCANYPLQLVDEPLEFNEVIAPGVLDYASDTCVESVATCQRSRKDLLIEHRSLNSHVNDIRLRAHYTSTSRFFVPGASVIRSPCLCDDFDLISGGGGRCRRWRALYYSGRDRNRVLSESGLLLEDGA